MERVWTYVVCAYSCVCLCATYLCHILKEHTVTLPEQSMSPRLRPSFKYKAYIDIPQHLWSSNVSQESGFCKWKWAAAGFVENHTSGLFLRPSKSPVCMSTNPMGSWKEKTSLPGVVYPVLSVLIVLAFFMVINLLYFRLLNPDQVLGCRFPSLNYHCKWGGGLNPRFPPCSPKHSKGDQDICNNGAASPPFTGRMLLFKMLRYSININMHQYTYQCIVSVFYTHYLVYNAFPEATSRSQHLRFFQTSHCHRHVSGTAWPFHRLPQLSYTEAHVAKQGLEFTGCHGWELLGFFLGNDLTELQWCTYMTLIN